MELNESRVWLEMIQKREYSQSEFVAPFLDECIALSKIIAVSRETAAEDAGSARDRPVDKLAFGPYIYLALSGETMELHMPLVRNQRIRGICVLEEWSLSSTQIAL